MTWTRDKTNDVRIAGVIDTDIIHASEASVSGDRSSVICVKEPTKKFYKQVGEKNCIPEVVPDDERLVRNFKYREERQKRGAVKVFALVIIHDDVCRGSFFLLLE